ncbi:MAG: hypothetical protein AB7G39_09175 [Alphaproteobacteria bacterium]
MADDRNATDATALAAGPARVQMLVHRGIDLMIASMRSRAQSSDGGRLSFTEMRDTVTRFKSKPPQNVLHFYEEAWEEIERIVEAQRWDKERKYPFERLVVHYFVHLLPERGQPAMPGRQLSRGIIPGFVQALQQLVGPDLFETYEERCRELVERVREEQGDAFTWDHVYADSSSQLIVNDVLVLIARHFSNLRRRRQWMMDLIDNGMKRRRDPGEKDWFFGEAEFHMLMDSMYRILKRAMQAQQGRQVLEKRYGAAAIEGLDDMLFHLDEEKRALPPPKA